MKRGRKQLAHVFVGDTECKWCSRCRQHLPLDRFAKSSKPVPDGLMSRCGLCVRAYDNAREAQRREAGTKSRTIILPGTRYLRMAFLACGRRAHVRLYNIWDKMKKRCHRPGDDDFKHYGAKGIHVCDEWRYSYDAFRWWAVSHGYAKDLTLDRIRNAEGYGPGNCRWATREEQTYNSKNVIKLTLHGVTKLLPIWAKELRMSMDVLRVRHRNGWPDHHVLTVPHGGRCPDFAYQKPGRKPKSLVSREGFSASSSPLEK